MADQVGTNLVVDALEAGLDVEERMRDLHGGLDQEVVPVTEVHLEEVLHASKEEDPQVLLEAALSFVEAFPRQVVDPHVPEEEHQVELQEESILWEEDLRRTYRNILNVFMVDSFELVTFFMNVHSPTIHQ